VLPFVWNGEGHQGNNLMRPNRKLVYIFTAAGDRAEDSVTGFTLATVGLSMGHDITIVLLGYGTMLAMKGYAETVHAPERQPLKALLTDFLASGGKVLCCIPCIKGRKLDVGDLVEGVQPCTAVAVSEEIAGCDNVISF
jgi:predicted peroxiredoxin